MKTFICVVALCVAFVAAKPGNFSGSGESDDGESSIEMPLDCPLIACHTKLSEMDFGRNCSAMVAAKTACASKVLGNPDAYCKCPPDVVLFAQGFVSKDLKRFVCEEEKEDECDPRIKEFGESFEEAISQVGEYDKDDAEHRYFCNNWTEDLKAKAKVLRGVSLKGCPRELSYSDYFIKGESPFAVIADFADAVCDGCSPVEIGEKCFQGMDERWHEEFIDMRLPGRFNFCRAERFLSNLLDCVGEYVADNDACEPIRSHGIQFQMVASDLLDYGCATQNQTIGLLQECGPRPSAPPARQVRSVVDIENLLQPLNLLMRRK